jgi:hypothetical protein
MVALAAAAVKIGGGGLVWKESQQQGGFGGYGGKAVYFRKGFIK